MNRYNLFVAVGTWRRERYNDAGGDARSRIRRVVVARGTNFTLHETLVQNNGELLGQLHAVAVARVAQYNAGIHGL